MSEKMNVLFIITDQQRADHLGLQLKELDLQMLMLQIQSACLIGPLFLQVKYISKKSIKGNERRRGAKISSLHIWVIVVNRS